MPHSGLGRWLVIASLAFGLSYLIVLDLDWPRGAQIAWKGAGVGLLALAAVSEAQTRDGWLLAAMLALGAVGDVLLDAIGMVAGALAFIAAHIAAITLYLSNRRGAMTGSQTALVWTLVPLATFIAWTLPTDRAEAGGIAVYTLFVAVMAACAWASRFPRYRTGIGAMMFLVSDLLIFARMGLLSGNETAGWSIWPLYYLGQLLIWLGVSRTLSADEITKV